jgi:hypothetical protein
MPKCKVKQRKKRVLNEDIHLIYGKGVCTVYSDKNNYLKIR